MPTLNGLNVEEKLFAFDSGATCHVSPERSNLKPFNAIPRDIRVGLYADPLPSQAKYDNATRQINGVIQGRTCTCHYMSSVY